MCSTFFNFLGLATPRQIWSHAPSLSVSYRCVRLLILLLDYDLQLELELQQGLVQGLQQGLR